MLRKSKTGRRHDKRIAERQQLVEYIPPDVTAWMDSGFVGADQLHTNSFIAHRGRKYRPLTESQKAENKIISSIRIPVEHAIGGMKHMQATANIWRNKIDRIED